MHRELKLKNVTIRNRIAIPPMVCFSWTDESGIVSQKHIEHYKALAEGGAGLVIVEATAITKRSRLADTELGIWEDGQIEGLAKIVDAIHAGGAVAFIQLLHAGGNGIDKDAEAPSTMEYRWGTQAHEMTKERIDATIEDFAAAALRAQKAGFDGVELHGCHGYLISNFCSSVRNQRTDAYGENKALFAKEVLDAVKKACGEDYIVGIRLGAFEPFLADGIRHAREIAPVCDFIDASYGGDCDADKEVPADFPCSSAIYGAMKIKQELPNMPVFGVHKVNSREAVAEGLKTGIDMVDVGKASLVDPAFAGHVLRGEAYGQCLNCNNYCRWNPMEMADPTKKCPGQIKFMNQR